MHELGSIVMVDAHVHVHPQADTTVLLEMAAENFAAAAQRLQARRWQAMLLLTEMAGVDWFESVYPGAGASALGKWTLTASSAEDISFCASASGESLLVVAGRQVVTGERIEVLALGTRARIADGLSLQTTIARALAAGATLVLPWAVGKWLGRRGRLVANALRHAEPDLFAGDNGGRPAFWPAPQIFKHVVSQGRPVLSGTDPLPLKHEERRVGSMGFWFQGYAPADAPGRYLQDRLRGARADAVVPFGRLENPWRFVRNQVALRVSRR